MVALATVTDLETRLGRTLTGADLARAEALLDDVSAAVRGYTGQQFTEATATTRLKVRGGRVVLPQRNVTAVDAVADVDGNAVEFDWYGFDDVHVSTTWNRFDRDPLVTPNYLDVTYTAGYTVIPDDIVAVVCQIAARAYGRPADETAYTSENVAGYGYSIGGASSMGAFGLLAGERDVLDRYKRLGSPARML